MSEGAQVSIYKVLNYNEWNQCTLQRVIFCVNVTFTFLFLSIDTHKVHLLENNSNNKGFYKLLL